MIELSNVKNVIVDSACGKLVIKPSESEKVEVEVKKVGSRQSVTVQTKVKNVDYVPTGYITITNGNKKVNDEDVQDLVIVRIPQKGLKLLDVSSKYSDIKFTSRFRIEKVKLSTADKDIDIGTDNKEIRVSTDSGNINIKKSTGKVGTKMYLHSQKGTIKGVLNVFYISIDVIDSEIDLELVPYVDNSFFIKTKRPEKVKLNFNGFRKSEVSTQLRLNEENIKYNNDPFNTFESFGFVSNKGSIYD